MAHWRKVLPAACALVLACAGVTALTLRSRATREASATLYAMSTVVTSRAWGAHAQEAVDAVTQALAEHEARLSLYEPDSDIARLNAAAGSSPVEIAPETYALLEKGKALSLQNPGEFALTIAPVTLAWGVNSDAPRVVPEDERRQLLALVDDNVLVLKDGTAMLTQEGMGVDLGGIAKGAACDVAREVYEDLGVENALLDIGGNVYARGRRPDGTRFRIGFRDPNGNAASAIAVLELEDEVIAVSGGYERYFEVDGVRYSHIFDPATAAPAQSDLASVGVVCEDGATADFYSTALYVGGLEKTLEYMERGGTAIALTNDGRLYVSQALRDSFSWAEGGEDAYPLYWVTAKREDAHEAA